MIPRPLPRLFELEWVLLRLAFDARSVNWPRPYVSLNWIITIRYPVINAPQGPLVPVNDQLLRRTRPDKRWRDIVNAMNIMFQLVGLHAHQKDGPRGRRLGWIPEIVRRRTLMEHVARAYLHGLRLVAVKGQRGGDRPFAHADDNRFLPSLMLNLRCQLLDFRSCFTPE